MAANLTGIDAALASYYSSDRIEAALFSRSPPPRQRAAVSHGCTNCGAPWHDEHQADAGPCFYCHARRPGELHVGDVVGGRVVVAMTRGEPTFDRLEIDARRAQAAMALANDRLREKQAELMARQAKLDNEGIQTGPALRVLLDTPGLRLAAKEREASWLRRYARRLRELA